MKTKPPSKPPPVVYGRYNHDGYQVWAGNQLVYSAGNHIRDSIQPALCTEDRANLATIRAFCIRTTREFALEQKGTYAGVEYESDADNE